jgi:putative intracellular protease/amidase
VEIFGRLKDKFSINFYSADGGEVKSTQNVPVNTKPFSNIRSKGCILLIPGGDGVKELVRNEQYIENLKELCNNAEFILTVCTGSILLSKTGILDNKKATSNKRLFSWTGVESPQANWIKKARWVKEGNIFYSLILLIFVKVYTII